MSGINHAGVLVPRYTGKGPQVPVVYLVDADSAAITTHCAITFTDATAGYVKKVDASGERVIGFAMQDVASPSADGEASVLVDISTLSLYEMAPDTGTLTYAELGDSCDIGADGISINRDASATDDLQIVSIDVATNTAYVRRLDVGIPGVVA